MNPYRYRLNYYSTYGGMRSYFVAKKVRRSSPQHCNLIEQCRYRPYFTSSDVFFFVRLPFSPSTLCISCLCSSFFLLLRPCLIHERISNKSRTFVHGHTFLHSWSETMTLEVALLHGATFLSNLTPALFVSFI